MIGAGRCQSPIPPGWRAGAARQTGLVTDGELLSLHRYYIWANMMREQFDDELQRNGQAELDRAIQEGHVDVDILMYMSLWYDTLYVVIEGWRELDLTDPEIDNYWSPRC